jgi:hypothetical protein
VGELASPVNTTSIIPLNELIYDLRTGICPPLMKEDESIEKRARSRRGEMEDVKE